MLNSHLAFSCILLVAESLGQLTSVLLKPEADSARAEDIRDLKWRKIPLQGFYEEQSVSKETFSDNSVSVSVKHSLEKAKIVLNMETDLPGDVVVHWGVYKDDGKTWEIPAEPYPPETCMFKNKALQTLLQVIEKQYFFLNVFCT